jgi:hypothetical protein
MQITFPFRPDGLIDELILRLVQEGLDSIVTVRAEWWSCWVRENGEIKRVDAGFIPRKFKDPVYIGIEGLACVTHPSFLREGHLFGEKVGILEITNPHSSIEVRDATGLQFVEKLMKQWIESPDRSR